MTTFAVKILEQKFNVPIRYNQPFADLKETVKKEALELKNNHELIKTIINCIDLTSLSGEETYEDINIICTKARQAQTAAVCFYGHKAFDAYHLLQGSGVKLAFVSIDFPTGQGQLEHRVKAVYDAKARGVNEIDMVLNREDFFTGNYQKIINEIMAMKNACGNSVALKVILESGNLEGPKRNIHNIYLASQLAMYAGADFIKTSTGKISVGATLEHVQMMAYAAKDFHNTYKRRVGIKVSGGVRETTQAIEYYQMIKHILGEEWLNNNYLRFGASQLLDNLIHSTQNQTYS